jgi:hypothetical protein
MWMTNFPQFNLGNMLSQAQHILKGGLLGGLNPSGNVNQPNAGGGNSIFQAGNILKDPRISLALLMSNDSLKLNSQEVSQFLKESMKLPQDMRFLLLMLALESSPEEAKSQLKQGLKQLIEENVNQLSIPVDDLQALLGKNSKEAQDKMMKLLQAESLGQTRNGQQITELVASLGKLAEKIKLSPQDAMETLMLLYIPWYPLTTPQKLELSFEMGEGEGEEGDKDISAVVYLETNSLGRFKLIVQELDPLQIVAKVFHEEQAKPIMPFLEEQLNKILADDGLPAAIFDTELIKPEQIAQVVVETKSEGNIETPTVLEKPAESDGSTSGFKQATRQSDHKQINVQPGEHISLLVLNCAYALARLIFEADEANRILQHNQ